MELIKSITKNRNHKYIQKKYHSVTRDSSNLAKINVSFKVYAYLDGNSSWMGKGGSKEDNAYAVKLKVKISTYNSTTLMSSATKTVYIKKGNVQWAAATRSGCTVRNSNNPEEINFTVSCLANQAKNLTFEFTGVRGSGASSNQTAGTFGTKTSSKDNIIPEIYTVTYNKGNFPGTTYTLPKDNNYYLSGATVTIDPNGEAAFLIPEGYIFQGWSINGVLQQRSSFSISKNTTLTATFKEQQKHILSYSFTGEVPLNVSPPQAESHAQGETQITLKSITLVPYYIFQGWKLSGSNQIITIISEMPNEDIIVEGHWRRERKYIQMKMANGWKNAIVYLKNEASLPYVETFPFVKTQQGWETS